jgi:acyl-coenzyme A synthetase/AMP-(fatty) acid ligase
MANHPHPDNVPSMMQEDFGTTVLITNPAADRLLAKAAKEKANQKKFTEFCGGKNGWNDYTERWH